jgi:hypothetical protein
MNFIHKSIPATARTAEPTPATDPIKISFPGFPKLSEMIFQQKEKQRRNR